MSRSLPGTLAAASLAMVLVGCGPQIELETVDTGSDATHGDTGLDSSTTSTIEPETTTGPVPTVRQVDILFVVDNSGSMGEEQGKIAASIGNLVGVLDGASPPVDYRIGVTTTDNGNPWCQGTGPEGGALVATSCLGRLSDFVFEGAQVIDATEEACLDVCAIEALGLDTPWIDVQSSTGTTNAPEGAVIDALRCMLPQGINGCGFEQPLESLYKSIQRFDSQAEASYGFHRDGALLAVVIITDEVDCSHNPEHETIFLPDGNRVFWSDPTGPAPTSAVCWNAGVECAGSGNPYDECHSQDLDENGEVVTEGAVDDAVLHPVVRYTAQLAGAGVFVVSIDGVTESGFPVYADALSDPEFQESFGIGPGCESSAGRAVPPVRIRDVVASVSGAENQYSICSSGFEVAMNAIATGILLRLP
ncbi:MAG: hypothetical protein H6712_27025 [Myxococcales bacterium]|nr:hypothetical protein [Myxococcales bacterium]MCB9717530.1 hypothetical protein [Myxococcales bacterium]